MPRLVWLTGKIVVGLHDQVISESGGLDGVLNLNMIESAIARPRHRRAYYPDTSLFELAAAYCVGIGKNHGFVDGNKRTGFVAAATFLRLNGWLINPPGDQVIDVMVRVGEGLIDEAEVAVWFSQYAKKQRQR